MPKNRLEKTSLARKNVMDLYRQGMYVTDIAKLLGISPNTASARKCEAMRAPGAPQYKTRYKPRGFPPVAACLVCHAEYGQRLKAVRCCWREKRRAIAQAPVVAAKPMPRIEPVAVPSREDEKIMRDLEQMRTNRAYYGARPSNSSPLRDAA